MNEYDLACSTKDHHQLDLLNTHQQIVSISPRLVLGVDGKPTGEAVIVIGVMGHGEPAKSQALIPNQLPAFDANKNAVAGRSIKTSIVFQNEVRAQAHTARVRPCPGGFSIGHPAVTAGTLGCQIYGNGDSTQPNFFITNNHVAANTNNANIGDPVVQPGPVDGGSTLNDVIGNLVRFIPINFSGVNEYDAAIVEVVQPWMQFMDWAVSDGIGRVNGSLTPQNGHRVKKSGRTTELTYGNILSVNATVRVRYSATDVAIFVNQVECTYMSDGGDSGSVLFDDHFGVNGLAIGLLFAGSPPTNGAQGVTYANNFQKTLVALRESRSITNSASGLVVVPYENWTLTEGQFEPIDDAVIAKLGDARRVSTEF